MKEKEQVLRCYAERKNQHWEAYCIDLSLAAQGGSAEEAIQKLYDQIQDYVYDAVVGQDRQFAEDLLSRRAPFRYVLRFYWLKLLCHARYLKNKVRLFETPLPMFPMEPRKAT